MVLQRKTEEASLATKRLKELLESRKASSRETGISGPGIQAFMKAIEHELEVIARVREVIITRSFLRPSSDSTWACMFGDVEVPMEMIQDGVMCCEAPSNLLGKVTLCVTSGNKEPCSEIKELEFHNKTNSCTRCNILETEADRSP